VIRSFGDKETERVFRREFSRKFQSVAAVAGNRLETLGGDRVGQYSIRVNDQWRICFHWAEPDAVEVEIVDYH